MIWFNRSFIDLQFLRIRLLSQCCAWFLVPVQCQGSFRYLVDLCCVFEAFQYNNFCSKFNTTYFTCRGFILCHNAIIGISVCVSHMSNNSHSVQYRFIPSFKKAVYPAPVGLTVFRLVVYVSLLYRRRRWYILYVWCLDVHHLVPSPFGIFENCLSSLWDQQSLEPATRIAPPKYCTRYYHI